MSSAQKHIFQPTDSGPAWQIAQLFPDQGDLSESDYLFLTERTNRLAEYTDGQIEVLPMPTTEHQEIVLFLVNLLRSFITPANLGRALMAPLRVKLQDGRFREPDVVFMLARNASRIASQFWTGADLVMEIVSEDNPERDLQTKRADYAAAGIAEYWIVDPRSKTITVLTLVGTSYTTHSQTIAQDTVESLLLPGFRVDLAAVFAAARPAK
jgi:Uma2 family endonuclease